MTGKHKSTGKPWKVLVLLAILTLLLGACWDGYAEEATPTPEPVPERGDAPKTGYPAGTECYYLDWRGNVQRSTEGRCGD